MFTIFITEDDKFYASLLEHQLNLNPEYVVKKFENGKDLLNAIHERPHVVTLDYSLPGLNGEEVLKRIKADSPHTEVIIVSGQENVSTAINLLKNGVYDYIVKDDETKGRLWKAVANIKENAGLKKQVEELQNEVGKKYDFSKTIVGKSEGIKKIFGLLEKAAQSNITVSVHGETGTGKEVIAKAIHYNSNRKKQPFVAINVSAIPKELIESELFGHEKGAFTGAIARREGKFEEAKNGTLFLDEIGEMDLNMQSKLLRVIQERELVRVGGNEKVKIDCRIVCATHRNLIEEVKKGNFRQDLYYRLLGLPIELPPLRERREDIILLAKHFIEQFANENKVPKKTITEDGINKLLNYTYPGNIRELKAVMDLAMIMTDEEQISKEGINFPESDSLTDLINQETTLRNYTHFIVKHYLKKYNNNIIKVAEILDIGKSTIYRLIKEMEEDLSN
jgi:DNA-binding NtrC family response regulator